MGWYRNNLPDETKTGSRIVHGDYKLDNMVFHPTENKVIGILDWELCTLGSPVSRALEVQAFVTHSGTVGGFSEFDTTVAD